MGAVSLFAIVTALCAGAEVVAQAPTTIVEASTPAPETPTAEANIPKSAELDSGSAELDWQLQELQRLIEQAHFRVARRLAESTREQLESLPASASSSQHAVLDVLSATLELALGQETAALDHMRAALRADPGLRLETTTTSPKVIAVLEAARSERESRPQEPAEPEEK